jgi:uncharacterized protein (DUF305 family)
MKTLLTRAWLPALLLAAAVLLIACGGASGGQQGGGSASDGEQGTKEKEGGSIAGMDHGSMGHGSMDTDSGGMARKMIMEDGRYSDKAFIDAMVPHHQGAVEMAEVALENAEHEEIRSLAEDIVSAQEAEIEELKAIKQREFGSSEVPMEMSAGEMQMMGMTDPGELANKDPFDKAFIDAMIPHHRSAIAMAQVALEDSDNPEIREIARNIVNAQKKEFAQLQGWRGEWYPEG